MGFVQCRIRTAMSGGCGVGDYPDVDAAKNGSLSSLLGDAGRGAAGGGVEASTSSASKACSGEARDSETSARASENRRSCSAKAQNLYAGSGCPDSKAGHR